MADSGRPVAFPAGIAPFSLQAKSEGILRTEETQHNAIGGIVANPEFLVQSAAGMISLSESYFSMDIKVKRKDGAAPVTGDVFRPECLFPELLWSDVDVYINSTNVSDDNGGAYHMKAWARHLLTQGEGAGTTNFGMVETPVGALQPPVASTEDKGALFPAGAEHRLFAIQMQSRGYEQFFVLSGKISQDERPASSTRYSGVAQALYIKMFPGPGSTGVMRMAWQPQEGFWHQPSYLPASSDLRVTLQHAGANLPFRAGVGGPPLNDAQQGVIEYSESSISLYMRRYHLDPTTREQISARLLQGPMHYPFTRARLARVNLGSGVLNVSESALLQGPKPGIVGVFFIPTANVTKASADGQRLSPWFTSGATMFPNTGAQNYNVAVSNIYAMWGSRQIPQRPYQTSDRNSPDPRAYQEYKRLCGDAGACLTYDAWATQYTSYWFDISKDGTGDEFAPGAEEGTGSLTIVADLLAMASPEPVTMFVVGFGSSHVTIDAAGNCRRLMY